MTKLSMLEQMDNIYNDLSETNIPHDAISIMYYSSNGIRILVNRRIKLMITTEIKNMIWKNGYIPIEVDDLSIGIQFLLKDEIKLIKYYWEWEPERFSDPKKWREHSNNHTIKYL